MPATTSYNGAKGNGRPSTAFAPEHPLARLTPEQIDEIGAAFQAIDDDVRADLGEARRALHPQPDRVPPPARRAVDGSC